jgi:PKD repeat protein
MKIRLMIALLGCMTMSAYAQDYGCATDEHLEQYLSASPENRAAYNAERQEFSEYVANRAASRGEPDYIIPVVVHVLYSTCDGNISMSQIEDGIRVLDEDFGRTNPDTNQTRAPFDEYAADAGIEFRLARLDPSGNPTNGVVRTETSQAVNAQNNVKSISNWPSDEYLNIWVVESIFNFTGGAGIILGYAQFPGSGSWNTYGLVVRNDAFGTIGTSTADGRTVTHEIGHCLNLFHTFQDGCGGNCAFSGDDVCDTPPAAGATYNCSSSTNTCSNDASGASPYINGTPDQIENYMSYNSCQNMFSLGQKERMISALEFHNTLEDLVSEENLINTGVIGLVDANFTTDVDLICQFQPVTFSDASLNTGEASSWEFGGEAIPPSSNEANPEVLFPYSGLYDVTYTAVDSGTTDSTTRKVFVIATEGQFAPYSDDLEAAVSLPSNEWLDQNIDDDEYAWKITSDAAYSGEKSLKLDNFGKCGDRTDELISQSFDLSTFSSVNLSFKEAFARSSGPTSVFLRIYRSNDCGETWGLVWSRSTSQLQSISAQQNTPFIPADESEWNEFTFTINNQSYMQEGVIFKFSFTGVGGNNLYIDDFSVNGTFNGDLLLRSPENGKIGMAKDVLIDWKSAGFVNSYEYEIDQSSSFDGQNKITGTKSFETIEPNGNDTEFFAENLALGTTYYWRVRYEQSGSTSDWIEVWNFTVSETGVGIQKIVESRVNVFPNPSNGLVLVTATDNMDAISILDYTGRMVYRQDAINSNNTSIQTNLAAGMYIMQVAVNGRLETKSLIIR